MDSKDIDVTCGLGWDLFFHTPLNLEADLGVSENDDIPTSSKDTLL